MFLEFENKNWRCNVWDPLHVWESICDTVKMLCRRERIGPWRNVSLGHLFVIHPLKISFKNLQNICDQTKLMTSSTRSELILWYNSVFLQTELFAWTLLVNFNCSVCKLCYIYWKMCLVGSESEDRVNTTKIKTEIPQLCHSLPLARRSPWS